VNFRDVLWNRLHLKLIAGVFNEINGLILQHWREGEGKSPIRGCNLCTVVVYVAPYLPIGNIMTVKKTLKETYHKLSRADKESIGSSLVKVNMGLGLPEDLRVVAGFLKGSGLVAKEGQLDDLIQYLHEDPEAKKSSKIAGGTVTTSEKEIAMSNTSVDKLKIFDEDAEITVKDHIDDIDKKK